MEVKMVQAVFYPSNRERTERAEQGLPAEVDGLGGIESAKPIPDGFYYLEFLGMESHVRVLDNVWHTNFSDEYFLDDEEYYSGNYISE